MSSPAPASSPPPATNSTTPPPTASPPPPPVTSTPPPAPLSPPPPFVIQSPPPPATPISPPPDSTPPANPFSPPPPPSTPSSPSNPSSPSIPPPPPSKNTPSTPSTPPPPPSSSSSSSLTTNAIIGIAIGGVVILLVVSFLFICCSRKRKRRRNDHEDHQQYYVPHPPHGPGPKDGYHGGAAQHRQQSNPTPAEQYMMPKPPPPPSARPSPSPNHPVTPPPPPPYINSSGGSGSNYSGSETPAMEFSSSKNVFTFEELERATDGFSEANLLGQGGFGYVLKGVLPNGKEVAVKTLKAGSSQGDREFQAEVEIISRVHHKHLVSLVGYCMSGSERMLVYEFVPNKTLEFHLHGKGQPTMNWPTRLKIALGSAKGLAYLHEDCNPKIIHRDIKAANILLDFKFEAKVADFGLAKFSSELNTHISTRVMGTFGYLAPEYASSGKLTEKSDVFSFGVMLLELITGQRPVDTTNTYMDDCLVDWAKPLLTRALENNNFDDLVDPRLQKNYNHNEMARMVACAAASVRHSARRRPRMSQVVRALEGHLSLSDLNDGLRPGHSTNYGSSDYDTSQYKEDMNKLRQLAYTSQEQGSSEYGGTTSEYGLNPSGSSSEAQTTREIEIGRVKKDSHGFSGIGSTEYTNTTAETEPENAKKDS